MSFQRWKHLHCEFIVWAIAWQAPTVRGVLITSDWDVIFTLARGNEGLLGKHRSVGSLVIYTDVFDHIYALVEGQDAIFIVFYSDFNCDYCNLAHETAHDVPVFGKVAFKKCDRLQYCLVQQIESDAELNNYLHSFAHLAFRDATLVNLFEVGTSRYCWNLSAFLP